MSRRDPSTDVLGYFHSSAARTTWPRFVKVSPRSGRSIVAQHVSAGISVRKRNRVRETDGWTDRVSVVRFTDSDSVTRQFPALTCWAIFSRPLRGL